MSPKPRSVRRSRHPVLPRIPVPTGAPRSARIAAVALTLVGAYALLYAITGLDVERRLLFVFLGGGSLPAWALLGLGAGLVMAVTGLIVARRLLRDARYIRDQDPRGSGRLAIPFALLTSLHALVVTGPLAPWAPAAPVAGSGLFGFDLFGGLAILLCPIVTVAALLAASMRTHADAWLRQLPD